MWNNLVQTYSNLIKPVQQGLSQIGHAVANEVQQAPHQISQGVNYVEHLAPQIPHIQMPKFNPIQIAANDFQHSQIGQELNTVNKLGGVLNSPQAHTLGHNIANIPLVKANLAQPLLQYNGMRLPGSPTIGQFAKGQLIKPALAALNPKASALDRVTGGVQTAFNLANPLGTSAFNVGSGYAAGALKTLRTGGNLDKNIANSVANPSDIGGTGLGLPDIPALAVDAISGNPKAVVKGAKGIVQGIKGYSPNGFKIHPDDQKIMTDFVTAVQSGQAKANLGQLGKDAQVLAEHYIGKNATGIGNQKLASAFDALLSSAAKSRGEDVLPMPFPKMGLVGDNKAKPNIKDQILNQPPERAKMSQQAIDAGITQPRTGADISISPLAAQRYAAKGEKGIGPGQLQAKTIGKLAPQESSQLSPLSHTVAKGIQSPGGSSDGSIPNSSTYLEELAARQDAARQTPTQNIMGKLGELKGKLKSSLIDSTAPIGDTLTSAEKQNKFQVRPTNDIRLQIDRVLRSDSMAGQFAKDHGLTDTIQKAPDIHALNQYMIAKHAQDLEKFGTKTGRDLGKDRQLIKDLAPTYEAHAKSVNDYIKKLLDYSVKSGLIDKQLADHLKVKYPNYVPVNRIFNELEKTGGGGVSRKSIASLSKQTVVQKIKGSDRVIENPISSLVEKTGTAFAQGEKNIAAKQLASYKDLPGFQGLIHEAKPGDSPTHSFSYLDNGVKKTYETTPEIAAAAKSLNKPQMNIMMKILSAPTRILRLGATGINYPFAISNLVKDQTSAFINSNKSASTQDPKAFVKGLFAALGHGKLYDDMVRNAGAGTSFDIGREGGNLAVDKLRSERSVISNIKYKLDPRHPVRTGDEIVRTIENLIGRTEEMTRAQQYHGTLDALIKEGRTPQDAHLLAAKAARDNTVNFARGGDFARTMNWLVPYFNAGIQGSRTFVRNVQTRPAQTLTKFAIGAGMPVAAATLWNTSDPQRKKAYNDIADFEKQNNIIIVPPNPTQDANGKWNVVKIPLSQEIASLASLVRRPIEQAAGGDPVKIKEMADALIQTGTSLNTSSLSQFASGVIPQAVKPVVESLTNKNLFTNRDIVPAAYKNLPADQQVKKGTSGTARIIGKLTGASPLLVENEANTLLGGIGSQLLNTSDNVLNKAGIIPDNQVSGKGPQATLVNRFGKATGGDTQQKLQSSLMQGLNPRETTAYNLIHTPKAIDAQGNPIDQNNAYTSPANYDAYLANPKLIAIDQQLNQAKPNHDPLWNLPVDQIKSYMQASSISKNNPTKGFFTNDPTLSELYKKLPPEIFQKRSDYFKQLQASGVNLGSSSAPLSPQMPPDMSQFLTSIAALKGNQRKAAMASPQGLAYQQFKAQEQIATNQQRQSMGLPLLTDTKTGVGVDPNAAPGTAHGAKAVGVGRGHGRATGIGSRGGKIKVAKIGKTSSFKTPKIAKIKSYSLAKVGKVKTVKSIHLPKAAKVKVLGSSGNLTRVKRLS